MTVDTLINKYRPKVFDDVIGQTGQVLAIKRALEKGSSRQFLLTGPTGVGKTTLARIIAHKVGCASAPDLMEVDAATHTGIDEMREVARDMSFQPMVGDARVAIVDECHALSKPAVTSLLKSVEEPPAWGYWIFCTTEPTKVPVAIKSRCVHLGLRPVSEDILVSWLGEIADEEGIKNRKGINRGDMIKLSVAEAQGSPRQALVNLETVQGAASIDEAKELLQAAVLSIQAYQLAQALLKGLTWRECQKMLQAMKDQNSESVRQVIRAYMTTCALSIPGGPKLDTALAVLDAFSEPCNSQDGISPIVIRCARLLK